MDKHDLPKKNQSEIEACPQIQSVIDRLSELTNEIESKGSIDKTDVKTFCELTDEFTQLCETHGIRSRKGDLEQVVKDVCSKLATTVIVSGLAKAIKEIIDSLTGLS